MPSVHTFYYRDKLTPAFSCFNKGHSYNRSVHCVFSVPLKLIEQKLQTRCDNWDTLSQSSEIV